jgi:putative transposase
MKASTFSGAQIAFVLKQVEDGTPIGEVCRKAGISDATFYNWRKKDAGLLPNAGQLQKARAKGFGALRTADVDDHATPLPPVTP